MFKSGSTERHPFSSILLLLLLMFAGAIVFTIAGFAIGASIYGPEPILKMSAGEPGSLGFLKLIQILSSIGMFVVPAFFFAKLESKDWISYLKLVKVPLLFVLLTVLIMFSSGPALEYSMDLNKSMKLPGFLKELEAWMLLKETQMEELTRQLLVMKSIPDLLLNLLMLALIPALGEELIFRGCLQKIFGRWTGNHHVAVWLSAIIFSTIHFQFYGFMPRMFLGALFGYFLLWSGSLWLPILAHFLNNGIAVITAFWFQQQGMPLEKMFESEKLSPSVFLGSIAVFCGLLLFFYSQSLKQKEMIKETADGSRLD